MTVTDDLTALLTDELGSTEREVAVFAALTRTPLLFECVGALVKERAETSLRTMCHDTTPLHELTERYEHVVGAEPCPPQAPFTGCDPITGAIRAMAALGVILVCDDDNLPEHVDIALEWLQYTNCVLGTSTLAGWSPPAGPHRDRLASILDLVREHEHGVVLMAWLVELGHGPLKQRASSSMEVLLDRGDTGVRATLRASLLRGIPAAPVPDPRVMALFSADTRFRDGLAIAWRTAGAPLGAAVMWSLSDLDGPLDHVRDISLTAAFAVLFDEVRRRGRRLRGPMTLRRVAARTAVIGGLDDEGRTVSVSGYATKMHAASDLDKVVVPNEDLVVATSYSSVVQADLVGARRWQDAARATRTLNRRVLLRTSSVMAAVLLIVLATGGWFWNRASERQHTRDTVRVVQQQAYDLSSEDPALGLLLAMAGDDLAAEVDEHPDILGTVLRGNTSLRRVLHADQGTYNKIAMSRDGEYTLLSTTTGSAELFATRSSTTAWRHHGTGVGPLAGGVHITAIAVSEGGGRAAIATTDLRITLLEHRGSSWRTAADIPLPLPPRPGPLNTERNEVTALEFGPEGKSLLAYGPEVGLFRFDTTSPLAAPERCAAPGSGISLYAGDGFALVTNEREVVRVEQSTCAQSSEMAVPEGTTLHGAVDDDGTLAAATRGTQLLILRPNAAETLVSDRGPYSTVALTRPFDGAYVIATTDVGTYGWNVRDNAQVFGHRGSGVAATAMGFVVRTRDSTAEVHDGLHSPATIASAQFFGAESVEWAGSRLVLRRKKEVWIGPDATSTSRDGLLKKANYRKLDLPPSSTTREVSTSRDGRWVAVLLRTGDSNQTRLHVWDVNTGEETEVAAPDDRNPTHVTFADDTMYVGYQGGDLRRFRITEGAWRFADGTLLPATVVALAAREHHGDVYAVVSEDSASKPSAVRVRQSDLAATKEVALGEGTGLVRIALLDDSQVVIGSGAGVITFLTPQLDVRGVYTDAKLQYVLDLTEIPNQRTVIVSGRASNTFLDTVNRTSRAEFWGGGPPFTATASSTDGIVATYNSLANDLALWSLEPQDLRALACAAVDRELTPDEWARFVGADHPYRLVCDR